jgi:hypothetical protein
MQMKRMPILLAIARLGAGGGADPLEQRTRQEVQEQLEQGVTGQGTLGLLERSPDDPAGQHSVPQTHP